MDLDSIKKLNSHNKIVKYIIKKKLAKTKKNSRRMKFEKKKFKNKPKQNK